MQNLVKNKATICIVHYKTPELIKLALRSIRRFTDYPYRVIVVDNDSGDESLDYLRKLKWICLIERRARGKTPDGNYDHAAGLDLGFQSCHTDFFVSMHSDVFVLKANWLHDLIRHFETNKNIACVGAGKIEYTPALIECWKKVTDFRVIKRKLLRDNDPFEKYRYYNRTICCLYRTEILKNENLAFCMGREKGLSAGKRLYFELIDRGYRTVELPPRVLKNYIFHLAHATQALNPDEFTLRKATLNKFKSLSSRLMNFKIIQQTLHDSSLDE